MLNSGHFLQSRYRILNHLAGGGMAEVYLAEDTRLTGRRVALKEMSPNAVPPADRNWAINAFRQEAQMLATLRHRGLTPVADFFAEGGNWYLVMEFIDGVALDDRLAQLPGNRLPIPEALSIVHQLCEVLDYLHHQNPPVIFRDLKPGNIMLTAQGEVKLIDFGIARFFKPGKPQDTVNLGTPGYAAPEQHGHGGQTDARTDVFSLGVVLHQLLTGHDPTTTPMALPPARSFNPAITAAGEAVILRATQLDPALRYQSVPEFRQALFAATPLPTAQLPISPPLIPTQSIGYAYTPSSMPPMPVNAATPMPSGTMPTYLPPKSNTTLYIVMGSLLIIAIVAVAALLTSRDSASPATPEPVVMLVTATLVPTPESPSPGEGNANPLDQATSASQPPIAPPATSATSTPRPTVPPLPTSTSLPPPTWTPLPPPTAVPQPTCPQVTGPFAGLASQLQDRLGCAQGNATTTGAAQQRFDGGRMYWRENNDRIYAVYRGGRWESHADTWNEGDADYSCGTPQTPPTPIRGFGRTWCSFASIKQGLGNALDGEAGLTVTIQTFNNGFIMQTDDRTLVLYSNGSWERY